MKEFEWLPETNECIKSASHAKFMLLDKSKQAGIAIVVKSGVVALTLSELERIIEEINKSS